MKGFPRSAEARAPVRPLRLFLALPLPGDVRTGLKKIQAALPGKYFRGLKAENFHLTLAFLGDTPEGRAPEIEACMRETCENIAAFEGSLGGPGAFPHGGEPRVVWVGLAAGTVQAGCLAEALRRGLRRAGVRFDGKPFKAHITVAYARRDLGRDDLRKAGEAFLEYLKSRGRAAGDGKPGAAALGDTASGSASIGERRFLFEEVVLMRSDLCPGGSVFTPLCRASLKGL
jgi:2'-5' RNA ligase